ncbi:uncharacterized protein LOC127767184 isoform X2 [Oryza glaberrima]|uniref:DUF547 domain-containing protein n=1 Tax=Oryza glaberrima TaxID=4538 RepID=I1PHM5_ORYGL|nr:uncharacterized protein LOC127767184 isoform X2 [Oryza glaberrima]
MEECVTAGSTTPPPHLHQLLSGTGAAPPPSSQDDAHPHPHPQSRRTVPARRLRQRLEQEVSELKKQLRNEEAVHDILNRALQHSNTTKSSSSLSSPSVLHNIPAFIPHKAKELLAELVLVEEEIARLETQIRSMKKAAATTTTQNAITLTHDDTVNANVNSGGSAAGDHANIKSMFFISQAINGLDTSRHHHPLMTIISNKPPTPSPKLNSLDDTSSSSNKKKKMVQQPNKLSERIVKCLICIFIRLLRSSRVADLQLQQQDNNNNNNNTSSRSSSSSPSLTRQHQGGGGGGSFRIDTSLVMNKQQQQQDCRSGQQDHYGIFAIPDSIVRDIGPYKNLVSFTSSAFDLRGFSTSPLLTKLRGMLEALQHVDLRFLTHHQNLAFWLNIYNTCIMHGILHNGLPSNPEKLLALKNKATLNVSGQKLNALVIENFILRQPSSVKEEFWKCEVDVEEQQVRSRYGLNSSEPNILFALCCGNRSSPALRIYKADRVMMDLEKAKLEYLQASLVVTSTRRRLMIPSLIYSNMHDFAKDLDSLVRWICDQLPTSWSLRKSMVDCLRWSGHRLNIHHLVDVIPYDYDFQYLLPM